MEAVFEIVGVLSLSVVSALLGAASDSDGMYLLCTSCGCQQKFDSRILCRRLPEFMNSANQLKKPNTGDVSKGIKA